MSAIIIVILILAILLVIFTLQNDTEITIQLFFWEIVQAPLALVILCCIVIGYLFAVIYFYPRVWKLKSEIKKLVKLNKKNEDLQKENTLTGDLDEDHPEGVKFDDDKGTRSFFTD